MGREDILKRIIERDRGVEEAKSYSQFSLRNVQPLVSTAKQLLETVTPTFGACAMLSAGWAAFLQHEQSIPAIVVAGDLKVGGINIFKCDGELPAGGNEGKVISEIWGGHCWIEVDGYIGDLSIFRTAYAIKGFSVLREFITTTFGKGRGALLCTTEELSRMEMFYVPKHVLTDCQIDGLVAGLDAHVTGGKR